MKPREKKTVTFFANPELANPNMMPLPSPLPNWTPDNPNPNAAVGTRGDENRQAIEATDGQIVLGSNPEPTVPVDPVDANPASDTISLFGHPFPKRAVILAASASALILAILLLLALRHKK